MTSSILAIVSRPEVDGGKVGDYVTIKHNGTSLLPKTAHWHDPSTLHVTFNLSASEIDTTKLEAALVMQAALFRSKHSLPESAHTPADATWTQQVQVRLLEAGEYSMVLRHLGSNENIANVTVQVVACGNEARVLGALLPERAAPSETRQLPAKVMQWPGVIAAGQHGGIRISNADLPASAATPQVGTWSLSMWVFLLERNNENEFASFVYKGTGQDQQRTPSLWMIPGGTQTCIKLSTLLASDSGADSAFHVPLREWAHVTFAATNSSAENMYSLSVYLDGEFVAGISVNDNAVVQGNNGSLWIGKDPSFGASPMLVADLQLREGHVGESEARIMFNDSPLVAHPTPNARESASAVVFASVQAATAALLAAEAPQTGRTDQEALQLAFDAANELLADCAAQDLSSVASLLALACDEGQGIPAACREYGLLLLQPARTACPAETKAYSAQYGLSAESFLGSFLDGSKSERQEATTDPQPDTASPDSQRVLLQRDTVAARKYIRKAAARLDPRSVYYWGLFSLASIGTSHSPDSEQFQRLMELDNSKGSEIGHRAPRGGATEAALAAAAASLSVAGKTGKGRAAAAGSDVQIGVGLLHVAAALGEPRAWAALAWRYSEGYQVPQHERTAALYYGWASDSASRAFYTRGQQPFHEVMRLNMDTIEWVEHGQRGDDDEIIQLQLLQAEQGDVASQSAMAGLYYWGARGVDRDQAAAARFWEMAAEQGDVGSMSALAGQYLKGEGVNQNNETALLWFERAAEHEHVRALNGLGAMYFQANGVEQNHTKAFQYFKRAAETHEDGDSMFNVAHCYREGLGVNQSWPDANHWTHVAAQEFGNFGAITTLAGQYAMGDHVPESAMAAISYYKAASAMGEWGATPRRGFDRYLARDYTGAVLEYLEAFALGQEAGASNAAYLLDRKLGSWVEVAGAVSPTAALVIQGASEETALSLPAVDEWAALQPSVARMLYQFSYDSGASDVALALGDYHFFGTGEIPSNVPVAMGLYAIAAGNGNAQAAYNLGYLYEQGVGLAHPDDARALLYYQKVMKLSPPTSGMAHAVPVYAAMARIHARRAVRETPWLHSIVSFTPGLSSLLQMPQQEAFASAVPGGVVDDMHQRPAGAGASHTSRTGSTQDSSTHTSRYVDAANQLASSWVSRWVRAALAIQPQDPPDDTDSDEASDSNATRSIVSMLKHPRRALLQILLEHGLPTVYVHYTWAVCGALLLLLAVAAAVVFARFACKQRPQPVSEDDGVPVQDSRDAADTGSAHSEPCPASPSPAAVQGDELPEAQAAESIAAEVLPAPLMQAELMASADADDSDGS